MKQITIAITVVFVCTLLMLACSDTVIGQDEAKQKSDSKQKAELKSDAPEKRHKVKGRMGPRQKKINEELGLNEKQEALFKGMQDARTEHMKLKRKSLQSMRSAFREELEKEKPNFKAVADSVKAEYNNKLEQTFNSMIDTMAVFYAGLDKEQRQKMLTFEKSGVRRGRWADRKRTKTEE